jgi:pilus assembly protein CpaF
MTDAAHQHIHLENSLHDVTDHVYHTLSLFEQLSARLIERCAALDAETSMNNNNLHVIPTSHINFGVITPLMEDSSVNDILINGTHSIYVERRGVLELTDYCFDSEEELLQLAIDIAHSCGRVVNARHPLVDARLPDGSRVNIVTPPASIDGVSISIRKFGDGSLNLKQMAEAGCMSEQMQHFLECCGEARCNIVVSGGTGAGKTTLLNAICKNISNEDRVVTIEDSAELQLPIKHVVRLESVTHEGADKQVTIRDLLKNALRMRPNRIIVGEVRGAEAFDMIQAMNTGHEGSLTTIHANTPRDGISRIENMIGMAAMNMPTVAVRKQIASAIHFIVQVERSSTGKRYIKNISEVVGIEGDVITMQDIFSHKEEVRATGEIHSQFKWAGVFPRHVELNKLLRNKKVLNMAL